MAKVVIARFVGHPGSLGYEFGMTYRLTIVGNSIIYPRSCPYDSIEAFLNNWELTKEPRCQSG